MNYRSEIMKCHQSLTISSLPLLMDINKANDSITSSNISNIPSKVEEPMEGFHVLVHSLIDIFRRKQNFRWIQK